MLRTTSHMEDVAWHLRTLPAPQHMIVVFHMCMLYASITSLDSRAASLCT